MASSGLPLGAFLTTIDGRRCTAVPRVAAASASADSPAQEVTTTPPPPTTTTSARTSATSPTTRVVAAPAADIDPGDAAEQNSSGTTTPGLVRIAEVPDSESGSSAPPPTPLPAALLPDPGAEPQSFTAFADVGPPQASVSSQADGSVTASAADTPVNSSDTSSAETPDPNLPSGPAATPLFTTIEPPPTPTETGAPDGAADPPSDTAMTAVPNVNNNAVQSTVAVAGGVIGGVVAISILAFFIWWWRRRSLRKRRSTLLTPLDLVPSFDRDEKGGYVIARGSIGPTPVTEKVRAALGQNLKKLRGHIRNRTAPSVNLDRGTSQFIDPASAHSRGNSGIIGAEPTAKDRLRGWWSGLGMKHDRRRLSAHEKTPVTAQERKPAPAAQPDFLTLLNMDDGQLDREAQRRRASIARLNGSVSSTENFLGGLDLNFGNDNPFSDANAIGHASAQPAPLAVNQSSPANPFSDTNAIRDPAPAMPNPGSYVADIRRSRSNSTTAATGRQPSTLYNYRSTIRDSIGSLRSMATATTSNQRSKFRSDPFDLERPELLGGSAVPVVKTIIRPPTTATITTIRSSTSNSSTAATAGSAPTPEPQTRHQQQQRYQQQITTQQQQRQQQPPNPRPPSRARTRAESFTSRYSKYSSGISDASAAAAELLGDWSDPGPDVGPAAARWAGDTGPGAGGGSGGFGFGNGNGRRLSGGSLGSVGKAM